MAPSHKWFQQYFYISLTNIGLERKMTEASEIGRVQLRNEYRVDKVPSGFVVSSVDKKGQFFSQLFQECVVDSCISVLGEREWKVDEATFELAGVAEEEGWPFSYGYKLKFFVQGLLVILVALGRADYEKVGRAFIYRVHA